MNPDSGKIYASLDEAVRSGEKEEDLVLVEGRQEQIDKMIANLQTVEKAKKEERRQAEKKRRKAAEASRRKNRSKR